MVFSGVYVIVNLANGKAYIGSSVDLLRRKSDHFRRLRGRYHDNRYLQNSWNKYGEGNFEFIEMERCRPDQCVIREQYWLDELQTYLFANGYNRSPTAGNCLGFEHTEETKQKMSDSKTGVPMPDWVKGKIREALTGKVKSAAHRANLWKNRQGWTHSEESKEKISASLIEAARNGNRSGPPDGWKHSEEAKTVMSLQRRGVPKSTEHKAKIGAAIRAFHARKRSKQCQR